eukprot:scaffold1849_cov107-Isochrysis_galbana.AAC.7
MGVEATPASSSRNCGRMSGQDKQWGKQEGQWPLGAPQVPESSRNGMCAWRSGGESGRWVVALAGKCGILGGRKCSSGDVRASQSDGAFALRRMLDFDEVIHGQDHGDDGAVMDGASKK